MKIYFTLYLIPVVILSLLVFWLLLRKDAYRLYLHARRQRGPYLPC